MMLGPWASDFALLNKDAVDKHYPNLVLLTNRASTAGSRRWRTVTMAYHYHGSACLPSRCKADGDDSEPAQSEVAWACLELRLE